jgi:serine/threonine-protein kinase
MSLIDAISDAEQMGLKVRIEQIESKLPTGRVLAQWPEPGTKIRGNEKNIILKISKSGERRPIPDIRGVGLANATRMLEDQGFTVGDVVRIKDSSNSGLPAGSVIAQSPASPGSIPISYKVDLLVSEGAEDGRVTVPNVSQMTESAAREMLGNAGLRVVSIDRASNRNIPEGQVVSTRPAAGAMAKQGDGVRITISTGEEPRTVATNTASTVATAIPGRSNVASEPDLTDVSMLDQPRRQQSIIPETPITPQNDPHSPEFNLPATGGTTTSPQTGPAPTPQTPAPSTGNKVAKVRYQVPPILRPLPLRIEIVDPQGKRVLLERNARANENVQIDGAYSQEAVVSIWLGGEFVWQERFR